MMVEFMKSYDWSNAPEWATHALTTGPEWQGEVSLKGRFIWAKMINNRCDGLYGDWRLDSKSWVVHEARPAPESPMIKNFGSAQNSGWDDKGIPPAGVECEVLHRVVVGAEWEKCKIIHVHDDLVWAESVNGPEEFSIICSSCNYEFRPTRTERDNALRALRDAYDDNAIIGVIEALDAGKVSGYGQTKSAKKAFEILTKLSGYSHHELVEMAAKELKVYE